MLVDLTTQEWVDLSVAAGTGLLAATTGWMAWKVRDQAVHTRRLADVAERQLEVTSTPVIRVMRSGGAKRADMVTVNAGDRDESLTVRLENRGAIAASIEACTMVPGGNGELVDESGLASPVLEPTGEWDVDFHPTASDKEQHARGREVVIQVVYEAPGSGARYRRRTRVRREQGTPDERWVILEEREPERV
jgi:hypothetical protein